MNANKFRIASVASALTLLLASASALAGKIDCTNSKKTKQIVSTQSIEPGDRPDRRMTQYVRVDVLTSRQPDWDGAEQTVYGHTDTLAGAGASMGYTLTTLKSGEKVWYKWESILYPSKGGSEWEISFQGVFRFIGGTGKYKGIRGGGHYRGVATPSGVTQDTTCEAEY